jgi:hypothetical protein
MELLQVQDCERQARTLFQHHLLSAMCTFIAVLSWESTHAMGLALTRTPPSASQRSSRSRRGACFKRGRCVNHPPLFNSPAVAMETDRASQP